MALHTLLGANGTIATALVPVLQAHKEKIRLVSRTPNTVEGAESVSANLLDREQVFHAVEGSDIVYLLVGLKYDAAVWRQEWPVIMKNVIDACKAARAKLIFFDNAYMYGKVDGLITEDTPYQPCSEKGKARAEVAAMLQKEMKEGSIKAAIARAVDFYGPGVEDKSAAGILVFANMAKGKKAQWFINPDVPRSYNYTPDAAESLYLISKEESAFGEIWHLPSVQPALTGRQFITIAARHMNASGKVAVLPKWFLKMLGWINPFLKEAYEMNYQDEFPFRFDSSKFEKKFNFTPTPYEEAIRRTADWFKQKSEKKPLSVKPAD